MPLAIASHLSVQRVGNAVLNALSPEAMLSIWLGAHPKVANALKYRRQALLRHVADLA